MIVDDDLPPAGAPDAFTFDAQTDVPVATARTSNAITIMGLGTDDASVALTVSGGTVSINGGAAATTGAVMNGDTVSVTATSGACGTTVTASVTIVGVVGDFAVTARDCKTNSALSALALTGITLTPTFDAAVTSYTSAKVADDFASTTVTATASDADASAPVVASDRDASVGADGVVDLAGGVNTITVTVTAEDGQATTAYSVTVTRDQRPMADAGRDIDLVTRGTATLAGSGNDPDGDNAVRTYMWELVGEGTLTNDATATPTYTAPHVPNSALNDLEVTLTLTVTFEGGEMETDTVTIRVMRDRLPTASADATPNPVNPGGTVTLTGTGTDADGNNPATAYAWACAYDDANLPLPACEVAGANAATASYAAPTMEELDELEIAGAIAITFTLTVTFTDAAPGRTATDQTTVTLRSQNREMVMAAGVVSLGAIDRSIAQQSTGLIAQRFNANIATPTGTGTGTGTGGGSSGGSERSPLVNNLKRALTPNARDEASRYGGPHGRGEDATPSRAHGDAQPPASEKLSHTAHAPGSLEARYEGADNWQRLHTDDINLRDLLERNPVAFALGDGLGIGGAPLNFWAAATHSDISGAPVTGGQRTSYNGRITTLQAGVDQRLDDGALLLGVALGWNASDMDFAQGAGASRVSGAIQRSGVTLSPYLSWRQNPHTSWWLLGGYGGGNYEVRAETGGGKSDASQWLLAGGVEGALASAPGREILARAGAFLSRSEVDGNDDLLAFESDSWQLQVEVEAARVRTGEGRTLRRYFLGLARAQGGDDLSSSGALGIGAGVKGDFLARGVYFDFGARVEAAATSDTQEARAVWKTIYGALRYDAGDDQRGVTASLEQGLSQALKSDWRTGAFDDPGDIHNGINALDENPAMQATLGYGWSANLHGHTGVLTAFTEIKTLTTTTEHAVGLRFNAERFKLELETRTREADQRTQLRVQTNF